jgi:hypothetical protein
MNLIEKCLCIWKSTIISRLTKIIYLCYETLILSLLKLNEKSKLNKIKTKWKIEIEWKIEIKRNVKNIFLHFANFIIIILILYFKLKSSLHSLIKHNSTITLIWKVKIKWKTKIEWKVKWFKLCFTIYNFINVSYMQKLNLNAIYSCRNKLMNHETKKIN